MSATQTVLCYKCGICIVAPTSSHMHEGGGWVCSNCKIPHTTDAIQTEPQVVDADMLAGALEDTISNLNLAPGYRSILQRAASVIRDYDAALTAAEAERDAAILAAAECDKAMRDLSSSSFRDGIEAAAKAIIRRRREYDSDTVDAFTDDILAAIGCLSPSPTGQKCEACGGYGEERPTQQDPLGSGRKCSECNGTGNVLTGQTERELAIAEFAYDKGCDDRMWHRDGKSAKEVLAAFEKSQEKK